MRGFTSYRQALDAWADDERRWRTVMDRFERDEAERVSSAWQRALKEYARSAAMGIEGRSLAQKAGFTPRQEVFWEEGKHLFSSELCTIMGWDKEEQGERTREMRAAIVEKLREYLSARDVGGGISVKPPRELEEPLRSSSMWSPASVPDGVARRAHNALVDRVNELEERLATIEQRASVLELELAKVRGANAFDQRFPR